MATVLLPGQTTWEGERDDEGHREYKVTFRVQGSTLDGPANVLQTPGLPVFGTYWVIDNDADLWAWCRWQASVKPEVEGEPNEFWKVTFTFSTKPPDRDDRACKDSEVQDPLQEPPKINGSFVVYSEEATKDRFGRPILNSAFERLRGPQVEFDANRPQVKIEMNVAQLDFAFLSVMGNSVNDQELWGMPARCIKLSEIEWERRYYGTCYIYYTLHLTFDIRADSFDRDLLDEATKVLSGHWDGATGAYFLDPINGSPPVASNPQHFVRFKDRLGNPMKGILNGAGLPAGVQVGTGTDSGLFILPFINPGLQPTPPAAPWVFIGPNISDNVEDWNIVTTYQSGSVVNSGTTQEGAAAYWIALQQNKAKLPGASGSSSYWLFIGAAAPQNMGIYKASTSYQTADYVALPHTTTEGFVHVEKYTEVDFTQLGIPLVF